MQSYRSSSTFVTVDLLYQELLPFVQNSFSGIFSVMLSHAWIKVGNRLPCEELQSDQVRLSSRLTEFFMSYCHFFKNSFPYFSFFCMKSYTSNLKPKQNDKIKRHWMEGSILAVLYQKEHQNNGFSSNLLGSVGDLYCFSNTLSMLVMPKLDSELRVLLFLLFISNLRCKLLIVCLYLEVI